MLLRRIAQSLKSCCLLKRQPIWGAASFHKCGIHTETSSGLALQYDGDIAIITMDNGSDNRFSGPFLKDFISLVESVKGNESCKGLVTTGGSKFYNNGLDLDWMATVSATELLHFMVDFQAFLHTLLTFPMPTLAVINGHAYAGGAVLAFTHDIRTMGQRRGWLCFNEVRLDKRFSEFMREFLRVKLGGGKNVSDALVLGRRYTAEDAHTNHLVHAIHPRISLLNHSLNILQSFNQREGICRSGLLKMKTDAYMNSLRLYEKEKEIKVPEFAWQFMTEAQRVSVKHDYKGN